MHMSKKIKPEQIGVDGGNFPIVMDSHHLTWGLFNYNGVSWYRKIKLNVKDFFIFLKRVKYILKNGYSPIAKWEMDSWFVCVMRDILKKYNEERMGYPGRFADADDGEEQWSKEVNHAIELLEEYYELYSNSFYDFDAEKVKERQDNIKRVKKEFFKWFSDNLEDLWD